MFPSEKVCEITGCVVSRGTYQQWEGTLADLQKLVEIGAADVEEAQNNAPTIGEFLGGLADYASKVKLTGYIIFPPREDARVSVEGFTADDLTADEALELMNTYGHADEKSQKKNDSRYTVRFWWD